MHPLQTTATPLAASAMAADDPRETATQASETAVRAFLHASERGDRGTHIWLIALLAGNSVCAAVWAASLTWLLTGRSTLIAIAILATASAVRAWANWLAVRTAARHALRVISRLRERAATAVLARGRDAAGSVGETTAMVVDEIDTLEGYFSRYRLAQLDARQGPLLIVIAVAGASYLAAGILLATLLPLVAVLVLAGSAANLEARRQFEALARLSGHFVDRVRALPVVLAFQAEARETAEVADAARQVSARTLRVLRMAFVSTAALEFFAAIAVALVAVYCGFALLGLLPFHVPESLDFPRAFFALALAPEFYAPLRRLAGAYHDKQLGEAAAARLLAALTRHGDTVGVTPGAASVSGGSASATSKAASAQASASAGSPASGSRSASASGSGSGSGSASRSPSGPASRSPSEPASGPASGSGPGATTAPPPAPASKITNTSAASSTSTFISRPASTTTTRAGLAATPNSAPVSTAPFWPPTRSARAAASLPPEAPTAPTGIDRPSRGTKAASGAPSADSPIPLPAVSLHALRLIAGEAVIGPVDGYAAPGALTAITGPSGSGKSTLLACLLGLVPAADGRIEISVGGDHGDAVGVSWAGQHPVFLPATVAENLMAAAPGVSLRAASEMAWRVGLGPALARRPQGMHTHMDERGSGFSGGERRRLGLARALLKPAGLLLLDEPTADLDAVAEREIIILITGLAGMRTIIAATHSHALAAHAAQIIALP